MTAITYAEASKEIRKIAANNGMTFKRQPKQSGDKTLFHFVDRSTHKVLISDCTLWNAYENCMNGCVESLTCQH